ncbi:MAG TPA: ribonuclease T [Thiotrichaceae bacterium]|jgi:ribonuclease T|nr:ribonuclease T [Thiotrichaceae bacterium]HIM08274.1 ribonuclease T [Gammaproteobacteria bacterium]
MATEEINEASTHSESNSEAKGREKTEVAKRFRGFLPVIVDIETAGFNAATDAMLEIAAVTVKVNDEHQWCIDEVISKHVNPFEGANLDQASLDFTGIDPDHPFRRQIAVDETEALHEIFKPIRQKIKEHRCSRAILVGHNAAFDINFLNAAVERTKVKRNPFHPFSTFDTATMAGLVYGQTVLARAAEAADIAWDDKQAHSARYDAEQTALLFCEIVNKWNKYSGMFGSE